MAGLDMNLQKWKQLCLKAWENEYDYLQNGRFARKVQCEYTMKNVEEPPI